MKRYINKVYGQRPKTQAHGRNMTGQGNTYQAFKRHEERLISKLDREMFIECMGHWIDRQGNRHYTI
jgi:hypothetical protein